jgi:hypothetical protein
MLRPDTSAPVSINGSALPMIGYILTFCVEALLPHLIHQRPKLVNILKAAINTGKADVGDFV